jgi:hypothetical protein
MPQTTINAIQAIQAMLTPAVGISAVALIVLGLGNRFSSLFNRIRLLNDERRRLAEELVKKGELSYTANSRYMSIMKQHDELLMRSRIVRNALLLMQSAIGFFTLASIAIGLNIFFGEEVMKLVPFVFFMMGMLCVLGGVTYTAVDFWRSYQIIKIEVKAEE